ncbi:MAG: hypothetical protein HJJLKODD_02710 [Phycisphaerae bacterium]|nr:hypothetical protein [Phycisphaerae bacterium]
MPTSKKLFPIGLCYGLVGMATVELSAPLTLACEAYTTTTATVTYAWGNSSTPGGIPDNLRIYVHWHYIGGCQGATVCTPPPGEWEVVVKDCEGHILAKIKGKGEPGCGESQSGGDSAQIFFTAGAYPATYEIRVKNGLRSDANDCTTESAWDSPDSNEIIPPRLGCSNLQAYESVDAFKNDLRKYVSKNESLGQRSNVAPYEGFKIYKTQKTLYTIPSGEHCGWPETLHYGEQVKAIFKAGADGMLLISGADHSEGLIKLVGHEDWQECVELDSGNEYTLLLQTLKGKPHGNVELKLDWYFPDGLDNCGLIQQSGDYTFNVEEMCPTTQKDPLRPQRNYITRGSAQDPHEQEVVAVEARGPVCATDQCRGNLTDWIVLGLEVSNPDQECRGSCLGSGTVCSTDDECGMGGQCTGGCQVKDGFMQGWTLRGNTLVFPGSDGEVFIFAE